MNEFYLFLYTAIQLLLVANSINPELATHITSKIINDLANGIGTPVVYLKHHRKNKFNKRPCRNMDICQDHSQIGRFSMPTIGFKKSLMRFILWLK